MLALTEEEVRMVEAYRAFRWKSRRGVFFWHGYPGVDPLPTERDFPEWRNGDEIRAGVPHHVEVPQ